MSSVLGQYRLLALRTFVFSEATLRVLDDTRVLHRYKRMSASRGVEAHARKACVGLGENVCPQQELLVLRRLHAWMHALLDLPTEPLQSFDEQFIIRLL